MRKIALLIAVTLFLFAKADPLQANTYQIDLTTAISVGTMLGLCYCSPIDDGPIYSFEAQPGDIFDFGKIEFRPELAGNKGFPSGEFPIAFGMAAVSFIFPHELLVGSPGVVICQAQDFSMCSYPPEKYNLQYVVPEGATSINIGWFGPFTYTPPVPEPSTWALLLIGFAGIGFAGYRRTKLLRAET